MNNAPPHDMTHISKEDLYSKYAGVVPSFATRCHLFCKYFFTLEINNQLKQSKTTIIYRNYPLHLKKKIQTTKKSRSKAIKRPNPLKKEQNTDTPSLKLCMPHQALLTLKFCESYIINI
jgi:hypothetical protein